MLELNAAPDSAVYPKILDPTVLSEEAQKKYTQLSAKVIGQDRAVKQFVKTVQKIQVGLNKSDRPAGVFLFMGPTGVGKTELVRSMAEIMLGKKDAVTRIDCGEYQEAHTISKLIGSPPGYLGFNEKNARLAQDKIDQYQTRQCKMNFVLFDEIEDASDALHSCIVQILDAGRLIMGNGDVTNFSNSIVVMTSNLGEKETQQYLAGSGLGLSAANGSRMILDSDIYRVAKAAAVKRFKPKFMNRVDRIIVFHPLKDDSLRQILKIAVDDLENRVWAAPYKKWEAEGGEPPVPQLQVTLKTTLAADDYLLKEGTSQAYGARELNRAVVRLLEEPIAMLIDSKQVENGDTLEIDRLAGTKGMTFQVTAHRDIQPVLPLSYNGDPPPNIQLPPIQIRPRKPFKWGPEAR